MIFSFSGPYRSAMRIVPCGPASSRSKLSMNPSSRRICAIACLTREAGTSTVLWFAVLALRMRVSMSAIGSVIDIYISLSPRRLGHAGHDARVGVFAETNPAHRKLSQVATRPAADAATVVTPDAKLRDAPRLDDQARLCH